LRIDNISATGDGSWNKTFKNTSFYSSDGQSGTDQDPTNISLEVDSSDLVDGTITIHDITASHLPTNTAMENVSFWFRPLNEDTSAEGGWARCNGRVPVQVPTVTPSPMYVPLGTQTTVTLTATGRGSALDGVYVGLNGRGLSVADFNSTTGADGTVQFKINPSSSGDIDIHVGEEGRVVTTKVTVTNKGLEIDAPLKVNEGTAFTVTVYEAGSTDVVEGASVALQGETTPQTTDANGQVEFTAPSVSSDMQYTITATYTAEGYTSDTATLNVINVPQLIVGIKPADGVCPGASFTVTVSTDDATPAVNAKVTFNNKEYRTGGNGEVAITAPDSAGDYTVTAEFDPFLDGSATVTVLSAESESCKEGPGFELLTLVIALGVAFILLRRRKK
jgi:hypothetical protein